MLQTANEMMRAEGLTPFTKAFSADGDVSVFSSEMRGSGLCFSPRGTISIHGATNTVFMNIDGQHITLKICTAGGEFRRLVSQGHRPHQKHRWCVFVD